MSEKQLQRSFIKSAKDADITCYRTSLVNSPGFPDLEIEHRGRVWRVELKDTSGSGNVRVRGLYKETQLPWIYRHLSDTKSHNVWTLARLSGDLYLWPMTTDLCLCDPDLRVKDVPNMVQVERVRQAIKEIMGEYYGVT